MWSLTGGAYEKDGWSTLNDRMEGSHEMGKMLHKGNFGLYNDLGLTMASMSRGGIMQ